MIRWFRNWTFVHRAHAYSVGNSRLEEEQITRSRGEEETLLTCGRLRRSDFVPGPAAGTSHYKGARGLFSANLAKDLTSKQNVPSIFLLSPLNILFMFDHLSYLKYLFKYIIL
jgi:hypothetical protein